MAWYDRFLERIGRAVENLGESILDFAEGVIEVAGEATTPRQRRRARREQRRARQPERRAEPGEGRAAPIRRRRPPQRRLVRVVRGNAFWVRPEYERQSYPTLREAVAAWDDLIAHHLQPEWMALAQYANVALPYTIYVGES